MSLREYQSKSNVPFIKIQRIPILKHPHFSLQETTDHFRFSAAVAQFGLLLRNSQHQGNATYENTLTLAQQAKGQDDSGYRAEFVRLVEIAQSLALVQ